MRPAPAERQQAQQALAAEGWTAVKISKPHGLASSAPMMKWCADHIGPGLVEPKFDSAIDTWYMFTWYGHWAFHFKHAKDATMFAIRWGRS